MKFKINYTLALIALILIIIVVSIGNRIATSMYYLKGFHLIDTDYQVTPGTQTIDGVTFTLSYIPKNSPYYNSLVAAEFNAFLVTIRNGGADYIDFEPMNFFLERGSKKIDRAMNVDEVQEGLSNGFMGSAKPIRIARKLVGMTYIPSARVFPGYERRGILVFPRFINSPEHFTVRFAHMSRKTGDFPDVLFKFEKVKGQPPVPVPQASGTR
ncbi:MAG: hypothetical protein ACYDBP_06100 [Leptospirales bacterium]